ncbi:hypothetical protein SAMN05443637_12442 [Pseudonocardia thermophila]|mgnify:CR=1 FL=1|jgi:hypothetical protein|uniref:Uncharacterized protein n=1 Tax=Pseudonocardia thermophila TaxID=1848 RepID=A0A1M6ZLN0_PSETH|nr:hypothetical protein [Pseudonocardia thermophila]SHL31263.1 hypothetical protein SAMN05443637_12442 [Pseudonocardia thermophila]
MSQQPQGPGWWQAPDGRWYPPQPPAGQGYPGQQPYPQQPYPQQQPYGAPYPPQQQGPQQYGSQQQYGPPPGPPQQKSGRGCLIAAIVVAAVVLAGIGFAVWGFSRFLGAADDVAGGIGAADCPPAEEVSGIVTSKVSLAAGVSLGVLSSCSYLADDRTGGIDVQITIAVAVAADEQIRSFESDAATQGATVTPIPVGERGQAYGGQQRSAAIAVDGERLIEVEVFGAGGPIGSKQQAAVALLERMIGS